MPDVLTSQLGMTSLALRVGRVLLAVPVGIVFGIALCRLALLGFAKLGGYRLVPALVAALICRRLHAPDLPAGAELPLLARARSTTPTTSWPGRTSRSASSGSVGARPRTTRPGEIEELGTQRSWSSSSSATDACGRRSARTISPAVDREYRRREGRAPPLRRGRAQRADDPRDEPARRGPTHNQNYLADAVLDEAPTPAAPGPDRLRQPDRAARLRPRPPARRRLGGARARAFTITWYFRVLAPVPGGYQTLRPHRRPRRADQRRPRAGRRALPGAALGDRRHHRGPTGAAGARQLPARRTSPSTWASTPATAARGRRRPEGRREPRPRRHPARPLTPSHCAGDDGRVPAWRTRTTEAARGRGPARARALRHRAQRGLEPAATTSSSPTSPTSARWASSSAPTTRRRWARRCGCASRPEDRAALSSRARWCG